MEYATRSRVINSLINTICENGLTYREAFEILEDTSRILRKRSSMELYNEILPLRVDYDVKVENLEHLIGSSDNW